MSSDLEYFRRAYNEIVNFLRRSIDLVDMKSIREFIEILVDANKRGAKILMVGVGRSGLVARAFAMRLMHLGFRVYVLGETITPSVSKGDVVVAISGSGSTSVVVTAAEAAKRMGAYVVSITSYPDSPLGKMSDLVVYVPGRTKVRTIDDYFARQILGLHEPLAPLGTLFELTTMVLLDSVIAELMKRCGKSEEDLRMMHANIEVF